MIDERPQEGDGAAVRRRLRWIRPALLLLLAAVLILGLVAWNRGYRADIVRSGSMAPALNTGDIVINKQITVDSVKRGQVVTFLDEGAAWASVTHRVANIINRDGLITVTTKGDANATSETWVVQSGDSVGKQVGRIPALGRLVIEPLTWFALAGLVVLLVAMVLAVQVVRMLVTGQESAALHSWATAYESRPRGRRARSYGRRVVAVVLGMTGAGIFVVANMSTYGAWTAANSNSSNSFGTSASFSVTQSYDNSNCTQQSYAVPSGYTSVHAVLIGGSGNAGNNGAKLDITFTVVGGTDTVYLFVGCSSTTQTGGAGYMAGFNGGNGTASGGPGGGGGGASAVCKGVCSTTANVEGIAGGGGGDGGLSGGAGGSGVTSTANTVNSGKGYDGVAGTAGGYAGGAGGGHSATFKGGGTAGNNSTSTSFCGGGGAGGGGYNGGTGGSACTGFSTGSGGGGGDGSSWYLSTATLNVSPPTTTGTPGSVVLTIS